MHVCWACRVGKHDVEPLECDSAQARPFGKVMRVGSEESGHGRPLGVRWVAGTRRYAEMVARHPPGNLEAGCVVPQMPGAPLAPGPTCQFLGWDRPVLTTGL